MVMNIGEVDWGMIAAVAVLVAVEEAEMSGAAERPDQMSVPHAKSAAAQEALVVYIDSVPAVSGSSAHNNDPSRGSDHCCRLPWEQLEQVLVVPVVFVEQLVPG